MDKRFIAVGAILVVLAIVLSTSFSGCIGKNDIQDYQIVQSISGDVTIQDAAGFYVKNFATVWTYPRSVQAFYSNSTKEDGEEDQSVKVHFNDGGTAQISVMVQFQLPADSAKRKNLHQTFGSIENVKQAVRAHLINCVKNSGPTMSATENQAARKGEFNQNVEEQLRLGIFAMRRIEVEIDQPADLDITGSATTQPSTKKAKVQATEIVRDNKTGLPLIVQKSPLEEYGIVIQQFSITGTEYDEITNKQFVEKQQAFLAGEQAKAQREKELQQTQYVIQQGLRQKAEIEATENVKKAQLVIQAQTKAEVAEQEKRAAETQGAQRVAVAELEKKAAETKAAQDASVLKVTADQRVLLAELEKKAAETRAAQEAAVVQIAAQQQLKVAELEAQQAKQKAEAIRTLAEAEQEKIAKAGALSEKERLMLELQTKAQIGVADALSKINVPDTLIVGSGGNAGDNTATLTNMVLLKSLGVIKDKPQPATAGK